MESAFFRDMAETSVDGLWVIDVDGGTRYANPAVAAMFGLPREEFAGLTVFDTLDADGQAQFRAHLEDVRAGRANQEPVDVFFVRRDGSGMWTLVSEQLLRDEDGEIVGVLHRLTDNDDRRRRMDELDESRRQLAEAHAIARLGSFTLDVHTGLLSASESMCEIYGLAPDERLTASGWFEAVHEDDRADLRAVVETVLRDGGEFDVLVRIAGPDGWIWTRARGRARRDDGGRVVGLSGTHQDVTAHKQIEQALERHIARNALMQAVATSCNEARSLGDALVDLRQVILASGEWSATHTYVPRGGGTRVYQLLANADDGADEADRALAAAALRTGEITWDGSGKVVAFPLHFQGSVHAVVTLTAPTAVEDPEETTVAVGQAATLMTRVIEREYAERQLAVARDEAVRASQAKSEFLAVMSHEIRTPLNGVIGLNDLMLGTALERRQRQLARGVRDAGRSLLRLVNDVLDLSKIEAGHLELEAVDFEVRDACDRAAELVGDAARRKGVELAVACDPQVPEVLAGDPTRLGQVLTNLVSNAVKFTEEGHVLVRVSSRWAGRRVQLRIDVTDTGEGIAPEALERVFEDFSQADLSTTRVHGGTGLGLSISRRIVEAMEGELTVASTAGQGSTFTFTACLEVPRGSRTCPDDDLARARLSGGRVLVVCDGEERAALLGDQMALWRARVDHVEDEDVAARAVERARDEADPYEAVVVDVPAAGPQELDHASGLVALPDGPRVFLLLTQRPDAVSAWATREPSVQVLTKPVSSAALRGALLGVDEEQATVSATTASLVRTDRPRVLVVEDNQVNQMVASGILESLGCQVELADDGLEGVECFDPERHDAVLMDVQMPRMDGYAATRAIRERHADGPRTPILAMTAAAIDGERERCLGAGMDEFLTKPVEVNQLGAVLARWVPAAPRSLAGPPADGPGAAAGADETSTVLDSSRLDALRQMGPQAGTYIARAVDNFVAGHRELADAVRTALAAADPDALRHAAHKLAGSALNLGLTGVGAAARAVELREDPDCSAEAYDPLVADLEEALGRALPVLEAYRGSRSDDLETA